MDLVAERKADDRVGEHVALLHPPYNDATLVLEAGRVEGVPPASERQPESDWDADGASSEREDSVLLGRGIENLVDGPVGRGVSAGRVSEGQRSFELRTYHSHE